MNYEEGTCIWMGPTYGYIGRGMYTNCSYEGQIYFHYKQLSRKGLKNPKYRELKPGDVVEFIEGEGYYNDGTQAMKVRVKYLAQDNDERQAVQGSDQEDELLDEDGLAQGPEQSGSETDQEIQESDEDGGGSEGTA